MGTVRGNRLACKSRPNVTHMEKIQVHLPREELAALRAAAARSRRSVAELVRDAIHKVGLKPTPLKVMLVSDRLPERAR